jgi:hypothetical protein
MTTETIDITPTWEGLLQSLLYLHTDGTTAEARTVALEELTRMARLADQFVHLSKSL